jgi:hypothetical protein
MAFSDVFANAFSALSTVYAFFDDGGAGPDHDYDDLAMRISVVPVPPALLLFSSGLAGLGQAEGGRQCDLGLGHRLIKSHPDSD